MDELIEGDRERKSEEENEEDCGRNKCLNPDQRKQVIVVGNLSKNK